MSELHVTPEMNIGFLALSKPILNKFNTAEEAKYIIQLIGDMNNEEHVAFMNNIKAMNENAIGKVKDNSDLFSIRFKSKFAPKIYDAEGVQITEALPFFSAKSDTGSAKVMYKIYEGGVKPTLNMIRVQILNFDIVEKDNTSEKSVTFDDILAKANNASNK